MSGRCFESCGFAWRGNLREAHRRRVHRSGQEHSGRAIFASNRRACRKVSNRPAWRNRQVLLLICEISPPHSLTIVSVIESRGCQIVPNGLCSVVGYRGVSFQCRSNLAALFNAQRSELKSILRSQRTSNLRGNCMFVGVGQADFKHNALAQCQAVSNESVQATLAEIS